MSETSIAKNQEFRRFPPKAGPMPSIRIGQFETLRLDNGLTLIIVENKKLPKVAFQLVIDHDPFVEGQLAGLGELTGELLSRGTRTKTKSEIDDIIDYYGANLHMSGSGMYGSVLKKYQQEFLSVMTDVLLDPGFSEKEFDKIKVKHASRLQTVRNEPTEMAYHVCTKVNFGNYHPYGDILNHQSLEHISVEDCKTYFRDYWRPDCSYLAIVGDTSLNEVKELIAPQLSAWVSAEPSRHNYARPQPPTQNTICIVDRPGAVQSEIRLTYPLDLHPANPDRVPASVMNHILGGGAFSGYLMSNLREDKGYTYGVRSVLNLDPLCGQFKVSTSVGTDVTVPAICEIMNEMKRLRTDPVAVDHLLLVKNSLIGSFARSIESPQTLANRVLNMMRFNLPDDFYETFTTKLEAVSAGDVQTMAEKYILPNRSNIVIVGDLHAIRPELESKLEGSPVLIYDAFGMQIGGIVKA